MDASPLAHALKTAWLHTHLHCFQVDQQVLWLEICLAKANMHIACLVSSVLDLAALEVSDCLHSKDLLSSMQAIAIGAQQV